MSEWQLNGTKGIMREGVRNGLGWGVKEGCMQGKMNGINEVEMTGGGRKSF